MYSPGDLSVKQPYNDLDLRQYTKKFVREFIETYRSLPALWKISSKDYTDRLAKAHAYEKLAAKLKEVDRNANRDTVKRKINSMRTTFRKEWRKVQSSRRFGQLSGVGESVYKPSLWYYDLLLFLCEQHTNSAHTSAAVQGQEIPCVIERVCKQEAPDLEEEEEFFEENSQEYEEPDPGEEDNNCHQQEDIQPEWQTRPVQKQTPPRVVSLPVQPIESASEQLKLTVGMPSGTDDEFDCIAKTWAIKLRRMSAMQKLFAERLVNDVIFEGELGTLSRNSVLHVNPKGD